MNSSDEKVVFMRHIYDHPTFNSEGEVDPQYEDGQLVLK